MRTLTDRARRRVARLIRRTRGRLTFGVIVASLVAGALGLGAWTALAQTITTTTSQPLPGNQFQGGDGNEDDAPALGFIDWQGLQADGRVDHTSDPQANDNIFAGGSKELAPDGWGLTTHNGGATPGSINILDFYRAVDKPPGGDVFLDLAFTRHASNGTAFLTFELNQDPRLWTNSSGAKIPCRTTGDILVQFEPHGDGASIEVDRWVTDTADPSTGCARTGHLVSANLTPNVDVQASFNSSTIANYLPGFYGATIRAGDFGEAAVNLTAALNDVGHPCAEFASAWMHSRSSNSDTADLKDYVAPQPFSVRTCKATPSLSSSASGSLSRARGKHPLRRHRRLRSTLTIYDTATLSGGDNPTGTLTFDLYGPDQPTCSGSPGFSYAATVIGNGSYQSGSFTPTGAGTYRWVVGYPGDDNNEAAGPTGCGDDAEMVVVRPADPSLTSSASGPSCCAAPSACPPAAALAQTVCTPRAPRGRSMTRRTSRAASRRPGRSPSACTDPTT